MSGNKFQQNLMDPNAIIGDTVHNPETVTPLAERDCTIPIPKPTFFVVGSAKSGSTMLASVLHSHPDCCHSIPKETNFFTMNFEQGWDWYRGTFAHYNGEPIIGEGSVSYGAIPFLKNVVEDLHSYTPGAKIVYIVRHPYGKLVSGWKMALSGPGFLGHASARKGFEQYVMHEEDSHLVGGPWQNPTHGWDDAKPSAENKTRVWLNALHFEGQVNNYLRVFPEEQVKVMFLEDWKADRDREARGLCEFLGLDFDKLPSVKPKAVNRADERIQTLPLFKILGDSKTLAPVRHLLPMKLRKKLRLALFRSPFGSRKLVYPDLTMSPSFRDSLLRYLKTKSASFLRSQGKSETFWDFDNLA